VNKEITTGENLKVEWENEIKPRIEEREKGSKRLDETHQKQILDRAYP
jgi:hypothetical protein